jgi:hypothetical protein
VATLEPLRSAAPIQGPSEPPVAHPPWLVEDDPATYAAELARQRASGAAAAPHPPWFVEDDPATFDTARVATSTGSSRAVAAAGVPEGKGSSSAAPGVTRTVTTDVDLRAGPDAKFASMAVLKAGTLVAVGECRQWCEVTVDAKSGWVFYTFLSASPASAAAR